MEQTALLKLPYIMPSQAQKHVTHNEALRMLDALLHIRVDDRGRIDPPVDPVDGQRHALGATPTGVFAGHAGAIAAFQDGAWTFHEPHAGWVIWDAAEDALLAFDGSGWKPIFDPQHIPHLGVHTAADDTNRLAVAAAATLLTHDGAGHQLKINKATQADTGSLLFQTGWSGRAEMGLAGNDDFAVKVSSDGVSWSTALSIDGATGAVTLPHTALSGGGADGQVQYKAGAAFSADTYFTYNVANRRLSVGTMASTGTINAHATGGVPCLYLTAESGSPYLQMQNGAVWQGVAGGDTQFITGADGSLVFTLKPASGPNFVGLWIANDGCARFGAGAPSGQARLTIDGAARVGSFTVAMLPSATEAGAGSIVFVSDETGGATIAFSDGTSWRRVADRAVVG